MDGLAVKHLSFGPGLLQRLPPGTLDSFDVTGAELPLRYYPAVPMVPA